VKFLKLEQRLLKQPLLRKDYSDFLEEYLQHGHMTPLGAAEVQRNSPSFYMPHRGVLKQTSCTTKLYCSVAQKRVVMVLLSMIY